MAAKYEMEPQAFMGAVKATCIKGDCSNEQFAAFLMVAKEYDLNPLTKEIYAFPDRGGITPIVSIDGWMNLINSHPQFDGMEFVDSMGDDGKLYSVECKMYRKDRQRPTTVIEYMSECSRQTDPWKKWPNRMLRHKSAIQCARYAFGFSGIMEPDEYERMKDVTPTAQPSVMERLRSAPQQPEDEREGFDAAFVHSETETALTGEILPNTNSDDEPPAPSSDNAGMTPVNEAGADDTPASDAPASTIPDDVRKHFIDFARKALTTATDAQLGVAQRIQAIDNMELDYRDVVPEAFWEKLGGLKLTAQYVISGDRTVDRARNYIAKDLLDCKASDLGGVDG
jgi:phage recombination protein Bet